MIATPPTEPTLTDVIEKLDSLSTRVDHLATDVEKFNDRFPTTSKRLSGLCSLLLR
jgi:hypothetical protein